MVIVVDWVLTLTCRHCMDDGSSGLGEQALNRKPRSTMTNNVIGTQDLVVEVTIATQ